MPASANWASGLDAISEAIKLYMGLREKKFDRERDARLDTMAQQRLEAEVANNRDAVDDRRRTFLFNMAKAYDGQDVDPQTAALYQADPLLRSTIEPRSAEAPLDLTINPADGTSVNPKDYEDVQLPGNRFREFQDSAMQREYYRQAAQTARNTANIASRERLGGRQMDIAERRLKLQQTLGEAGLALRRYGIDVSSADRMRQLTQLLEYNTNRLDDAAFDNQVDLMRANPLMMLQYLNGQVPMPVPPRPQYFTPGGPSGASTAPQPGGGLSPGGGTGPWQEVR